MNPALFTKIAPNPLALPATVEPLPHGTARVTIGQSSCIYANAAAAGEWLRAMERAGKVRILNPGALPC